MLSRICSLLRISPPAVADRGYLQASGPTVPIDGTDGYQTGCIFAHTDGGAETALYVNEGSVTSCDFNAVVPPGTTELDDLSDVGTLAYTSGNMLVADGDSYEETDDIALPKEGSFALGAFASSTAGSGKPLDATTSVAAAVYTDDGGAAIGSGVLMRCIRGRTLLTYTGGNREQEVASIIGQCNSVGGTNRHNMCGVMGSYELSGSSALTVDGQAWGTDPWIQAAIIGRVGVGSAKTTLNANGVLAGLAAMSGTTSFAANNGTFAGLFVGKWSGATDWGYGLVVDGAAVTMGLQVGKFASGGATTDGVPFATGQDIYSDGQLSSNEMHGATASALGSGYCSQVLRARHIANGVAGITQETYGVKGQLVLKSCTTSHLHCGVLGTLEVQTAMTSNGAYTHATSAVQGRVGGGSGLITGTKSVSAITALNLDTSMGSGELNAFSACSTGSNNFTNFLAVADCDYFASFDSGSSYEDGCSVNAGSVTPGANGSVAIKIEVAGTDYYIVAYAAGELSGE